MSWWLGIIFPAQQLGKATEEQQVITSSNNRTIELAPVWWEIEKKSFMGRPSAHAKRMSSIICANTFDEFNRLIRCQCLCPTAIIIILNRVSIAHCPPKCNVFTTVPRCSYKSDSLFINEKAGKRLLNHEDEVKVEQPALKGCSTAARLESVSTKSIN